MSELVVPRQFCGPARSGNGGWTAGALAALIPPSASFARPGGPAVEVTLRLPPPLDTAMPVRTTDGGAVALLPDGETTVAEAVAVPEPEALVPVAGVDAAIAVRAAKDYPGFHTHPFPRCFVCGPDRAEDDGLRIFPGPVGDGRMAAPWVPHPALVHDGPQDLALTWAALDCPGGFAGGQTDRTMVLGRIRARVDALPRAGEPHVVVAENRGTQGRRTFTATTLYDADARLVGTSEQVWVEVDPGTFRA